MKNKALAECYGLLIPKKGMKKFFDGRFLFLVCSIAAGFVFTLAFVANEKEKADNGGITALRIIILMIAAAAVMADVLFSMRMTSGIASKDRTAVLFLSTAPDIGVILKKALICEEIRRFFMYLTAYGAAAVQLYISGVTMVSAIVMSTVSCIAFSYGTAAVSIFISRRFTGQVPMLIGTYIIMLLPVYTSLSAAASETGIVMTVISIVFAAIGVMLAAKGCKRAVRCCYGK